MSQKLAKAGGSIYYLLGIDLLFHARNEFVTTVNIHWQQTRQSNRTPMISTLRKNKTVALNLFLAIATGWLMTGSRRTNVQAFLPPIPAGRVHDLCQSVSSDADLLQDLPFVPKEVMAKFMTLVGDPLTASSLQAGYQAGAVSKDELETISQRLPGMSMELPEAQSIETIESHWRACLEGQPWHVQSMGKLATATIVPLVHKLQKKSVEQAKAMSWINENTLAILQTNETILQLFSSEDNQIPTSLGLNNTRAKFETDRGVWSASMDVFVPDKDKSQIQEEPSTAGAALQALKDGMDDDGISSFDVDVLDEFEPLTKIQESNCNKKKGKIGLVNAYFVPDDEIKILVVEIEDVLYNVTWKGLD